MISEEFVRQRFGDQAPVSTLYADPSMGDVNAANRRMNAIAHQVANRTGVVVNGLSGDPDGSTDEVGLPAGPLPGERPTWPALLLGLMLIATVTVGVLITRWERQEAIAVLARYGATLNQLAGAAAAQAAALIMVPMGLLAAGLALSQGTSQIDGSLLGSFIVQVEWLRATGFIAVAAVLAAGIVFIGVRTSSHP